MLNKKGFTIVEVIVSFSLVTIILASMVSATMYYRDKVKSEEVISQLMDFKNTVTTTIYDDILNKGITSVDSCIGLMNCVNLIDKDDVKHVLKIVEYDESTNTTKKGVYLSYDDMKYMLPDSDLGDGGEVNTRICDFVGGIEINSYENKIYKVKISFYHKDMDKKYDILFLIN